MDLKRRNSEILTEAPSPLTETAGHGFVRYLFSLTLLVLYCLLPTLALAGAAYVQQNGTAALYDASPVTSTVITISTAPAVGNTIIITFSANRSSGSGSLNCSDNMGNSYTTDLVNEYISSPPNYVTVAICSAQVAAAKVPSTITLTHHQSYNRVAMVHEYSGVLSAPAADRSSSGGGNSNSPSSGTTATTTQANELLVGAIAVFDGTTTIFNSDGSFSGGPFKLAQNSGTDQRTLQTQYRIVSSTGAYSYAPTLTASKKWAAGIVTYKASPTCTVTNINDSGAGSLRNCITTANSTPGTTINFNIATAANQSSDGDSWWRIALATRLPDISGANTIIDGTTQTTSQGNTNTLGPEIEINGTTAGAGGWDGFSVVSPATGVAIKGFIINKWTGSGVVLWSGTGTITGNYIGTNYAGAAALGNTDYGIYVGTNGNVIGGTTVADRNVIAGNIGPGIHVDSSNNIIQGNYIGVNVTATAVLANTSYGIGLGAAATGNTIGGTATGAGNVISGNTTDGINHSASGTNNVYGNYIGTNASSAALANGGIGLSTSAGTINLGNAGEVQSNIIGPNTGVGINLAGGTLNLSGTVTVNDDVTFSTGTLAMGSATLNLSGNWTRTSATVTPGTSTVNLNGAANQTITSGGATFYHLTLNNTGASGSDKIRIAGALDVNGTLTITDGLLDISTTAPANNATVNTAGNVTIAAAGSVDVTGRTANWTFDGTSILTDASGGGPQQLNNVVLNGTSLTLGSAAKMKSFTNTLGTMNLGGSGYILELTGTGTPLSNSGTFTAGTSTVKYTGTTTVTNIATVPYSSLWLAPTAATTYSLTGHLTGGNAMTGNLTVDTNATLDVVSGSNYNVTTVNVMLNGTYLARVSTINVGGNWNMTNGTFTRGTSTVNFTGTGTITNNNASWWAKSFYNLTAAAAGNTTTFDTTSGGVNIVNVLTLGTGTLSGGQALLSKDTGTPLITAGATLSNTAFKYDGSTGPVNVAATTYPELWVAGNNPVNTFNLAGNITCNNLFIYGNGSGNTAVLDTTISNYSINCNLLSVGTNAATTYGTLTLNNSTATINGNVTVYASDASGTNQINAGGSTINVSGSWTNNDTFTASTGTVVLNGTNQTITGSTTFNNLTKSVATARTLTFAASSTTTINGVATFNGASGQLLSLVSSSPATQWNFNLGAAATKVISFVSVSDSNASGSDAAKKPILPTSSTDGGNNIAWFGFVISGTVYSDEATTLIGNGAVIRLLMNGVSQGTSTTAGGTGTYSITVPSLSSGDSMLVYIDGFATKGSTATVSSGADLSGLNIYGGHLIVRHDNAGSVSNANIKAAKGVYVDSDIEYSVDASNNITVSGGTVLYLPAGKSYTPGANITTPAMKSLGTFNGGSGSITVNGALIQNGGVFTATSGTTSIAGDFTISSGTFTHNSGTITLIGTTARTINTGGAIFNHLIINATTSNASVTVVGTVTVAGNLVLSNYATISGGTIAVAGNITTTAIPISFPSTGTLLVNGNGAQLLGASGGTGTIPGLVINKPSGTLMLQDTLVVLGSAGWNWTAGTVDAGTSTVDFSAISGQGLAMTVNAGSMAFNNVTLNMGPWDLTVTGTMTVNGNLAINSVGYFTGGTVAVAGNVSAIDPSGASSSVTLLLNGAGAQTFSAGGGTGNMGGSVSINKPSGTLTLQDTLNIGGGWSWTAGSVIAGTSNVVFSGPSAKTVNSGAMVFNNVAVNIAPWDMTVTGIMEVAGNLIITSVTSISGGTINVGGDLISTDVAVSGNVAITLNGSGAQSITATGADLPNGLLTVNKASGTATLASNLILNSSGQDLTITQGKLDLAGYNVTFTAAGDVLTVDANGTLQLQGGETITVTTKTFNAGSTVIYNGAISYGSLVLGNTYSNLVFNNGTGSWSHTGVLTTNNLTITAGTLSSGGQNINVAGNWSNSGTYAAGSNTVTFTGTNQSLSGNTIFNSLTKSVATARTLTFSAGSTTTINGTAILNGASGQPLTLASSSPGTHWNLNLTAAATKALSFVSVAWGDASSSNASQKNINPASSTDGGNNIAWFGFIVSGTVYIDEATTLIGNGAVIRLLVNGASQGTSTTVGGTGTYSINVPSLSGGDAMLVYIDGFATKGSTATVSNGANLSGLNIYGGHLIARHDNGGSLSNANMKAAKGAYVDADIDYSVDAGNNLTVSGSGTELYVANGHSYTPGAVVTTPALENVGVFDGGAAAININGRLTISGGSFTHTNGTTTINGDYEFTGGTVISNNGTVIFYSTGTNWTITGSHILANIKFDNNSGNSRIWTITGGTEITATGTVTFDNTSSFGTNINTGIINAKGDIVVADSNNYGGTATLKINGTGNQSFSGSATQISGALPNIEINKPSGTLTVAGTLRNLNNSWTYNTGALSVTGSTIVFSQNGTLTGSHSLNNAVFSNDNTGGRTWSISSGTQLTVTGTLTFDSSSTGTMGIGTGIINAQGDILVADGNSYGGTATLIINGAGNQLFTGSATRTNGDLPNIEINKPSGTLTIAGTLRNEENSWTYVAGTLSATGSTVIFANSIGTGSLVGTHSLDNVIFDNNGGNWRTWNLGAGTVLTIAGVLTIDSSNPTYGLILNNGTLNALGDVVIGGPANGGTTTLSFSGTALQNFNLTGAATELDLDVLVNKSGGRVNLLSPLYMDANNQDLIIQMGMFDLNGNNLVVNGIGSTFLVQSGGALQLQGGETTTLPTLNTGSTVIYNGGGSYGSLAVGNSYSNLTFNNATGSWTHTAPLNVGQNLTITAGTLNSTGQNVTLAGNWSNSGTYTPGANTVALTGTGQNISGSTTFNNLTKDVINADTLTFSNGTTQSISGVLVMTGRSGNILNLRSATPGSQWNLNVSGSSSVSHVDVDDSNASSGNAIYAYYSSDDTVASNNNNWVFQSLQLVKQVWTADGSLCLASIPADSNCNSNATSIVVPTSSTVTFLIFIRNVIAVAVTDVRFQDLLDDTAFTYQMGSLFRSANNAGAPSDNANLATIMAAASIAQTDNYDGDTQVDEFTGINTVASPDDLQVGGAGGVAQNDSLTIPANKTFAVKFKALKN